MQIIASKKGRGAFSVVCDGPKVIVTIESDEPRTFMDDDRKAIAMIEAKFAELRAESQTRGDA